MTNFEELAEQLSMTELIRLQDVLSKAIVRRFEKRLALVFSDVVGSTPYFARFGDEAGRKLQQRHYDLVTAAITPEGGRVVDTAGDGVFLCFESVTAASRAMVRRDSLAEIPCAGMRAILILEDRDRRLHRHVVERPLRRAAHGLGTPRVRRPLGHGPHPAGSPPATDPETLPSPAVHLASR